jgi:hypothetical protein
LPAPDHSVRRLRNVDWPTLQPFAGIHSAKEIYMNDGLNRPIVPAGIDLDDDEDTVPEHERRDDRTVGGGVMDQGGTAIDRGTGTLGGQAQGPAEDDDTEDPMKPQDVDEDEIQPNPQMHG